ncbi:MAG TPA: DUF6585 family protein [Ktedonobacteraceae bacterium]|nr:DUF6585 family protein [Ktedonobacteraceae bacterium]
MAQALQSLSPEAIQYAEAYQLGTPTAEFKVGYSKMVVIALCSCFGLAILFAAILFLAITSGRHNAHSTEQEYLMFAAIAAALLGGIYYALYPIIYRSYRVYIYTYGFVVTKRGQVSVFPWQEVDGFWMQVVKHRQYGISTGTTHKYTVQRRDGTKVVFKDDYVRIEQLGDTISDQLTAIMMPQALATVHAGGTVDFGPISVGPLGLMKGNKVLPWQEVQDVDIRKGQMVIEKQGKYLNWATFYVWKIKNVMVFLHLVNHVLQEHR